MNRFQQGDRIKVKKSSQHLGKEGNVTHVRIDGMIHVKLDDLAYLIAFGAKDLKKVLS